MNWTGCFGLMGACFLLKIKNFSGILCSLSSRVFCVLLLLFVFQFEKHWQKSANVISQRALSFFVNTWRFLLQNLLWASWASWLITEGQSIFFVVCVTEILQISLLANTVGPLWISFKDSSNKQLFPLKWARVTLQHHGEVWTAWEDAGLWPGQAIWQCKFSKCLSSILGVSFFFLFMYREQQL